MAELRARALTCTDCNLSQTRTQVVFGTGNPETPMVLIGEGPGEQEDATGIPFVGRAGKLLDEVLRVNGISRNHVWITNVLKCRAFVVEGGRATNRPPRVEEVSACRQWIEAEIALINPLVIVCVGGPAAKLIIGSAFQSMTRQRGQWFTDTEYAPYVMPILHPAYVLRQHGPAFEEARQLLIDDLRRARDKVRELRRHPPPPRPPKVVQQSLF
ncbi:MAG TPA: uracil-DNA glycosylase [Armatimonadetes bacterium]|nr:uracil-DNA glycosylase [Armatimonadota bacterium]